MTPTFDQEYDGALRLIRTERARLHNAGDNELRQAEAETLNAMEERGWIHQESVRGWIRREEK